jgi:hypothetical protein
LALLLWGSGIDYSAVGTSLLGGMGAMGKKIARKERSEALLHGRNGLIRTRNTYGYDPGRSRG